MAQWLECWTWNQKDRISNPLATVSKLGKVSFTSHCLGSFRCINEHLAMDSGGFSMFCHSCINEHLATDSGGFSTVDVRMNSPSNCGTAEYFLEKSSWDWNE